MAYVVYEGKLPFRIGEWAVTKKKLRSKRGYFEKGTNVKVVGISDYGYTLEDAYGNQITDCGFKSIKKINSIKKEKSSKEDGSESVVMKKAVNEVKYWLEHNEKTMKDEKIDKAAEKALNLYINYDYSSLEAAVEDILTNIFKQKGGK